MSAEMKLRNIAVGKAGEPPSWSQKEGLPRERDHRRYQAFAEQGRKGIHHEQVRVECHAIAEERAWRHSGLPRAKQIDFCGGIGQRGSQPIRADASPVSRRQDRVWVDDQDLQA
jgi:hypothetical protein